MIISTFRMRLFDGSTVLQSQWEFKNYFSTTNTSNLLRHECGVKHRKCLHLKLHCLNELGIT